MIQKRIDKLRNQFIRYNIDGYVIPKNDEFFSEYSNKIIETNIASIKEPTTVISSQYKEIFKAFINLLSWNISK